VIVPKRGSLLAAALVAMIATGAIAPAAAASPNATNSQSVIVPNTLVAIQAAGARSSSERIAAINRAIPNLTRNDCISEASRDQALAILEGSRSGLETLAAELAVAADVATATTLYRQIFERYRVYAVVIPQSYYAAAADCLETVAIPALVSAEAGLQTALDTVYSDQVTPQIEADMAEVGAQIAIAQDSVSGQAAQALAVTADDYNANSAVLQSVRSSISTATSAARLARLAANAVVEALR
jgi:hypothetical protein